MLIKKYMGKKFWIFNLEISLTNKMLLTHFITNTMNSKT